MRRQRKSGIACRKELQAKMPESNNTNQWGKGDVVLVSVPSSEEGKLQVKRRPALIVSNNRQNKSLDDVLLVPLTTRVRTADRRTACEIISTSPEGKQSGLKVDSVVDCSVIATIPKTLLVSKIGQLSPQKMQQVDACIRNCIDPADDDGFADAAVPKRPSPPPLHSEEEL